MRYNSRCFVIHRLGGWSGGLVWRYDTSRVGLCESQPLPTVGNTPARTMHSLALKLHSIEELSVLAALF